MLQKSQEMQKNDRLNRMVANFSTPAVPKAEAQGEFYSVGLEC